MFTKLIEESDSPEPDPSFDATITDDKIMDVIKNQEFVNSLTSLIESRLHDDPAAEVYKIMYTFQNIIKSNGAGSFNLMYVLFDSDFKPIVVLEPRPYTSKDEMYIAITEMLFSYSSLIGHSFMVASDSTMTQFNRADNTTEQSDAIAISFVSDSSAASITLPYQINSSTNDVIWNHEKFICLPIQAEDGEGNYSFQGIMSQIFFIMSHLKKNCFPMNTLINYYNFRDFVTMLPSDSIVKKINITL